MGASIMLLPQRGKANGHLFWSPAMSLEIEVCTREYNSEKKSKLKFREDQKREDQKLVPGEKQPLRRHSLCRPASLRVVSI